MNHEPPPPDPGVDERLDRAYLDHLFQGDLQSEATWRCALPYIPMASFKQLREFGSANKHKLARFSTYKTLPQMRAFIEGRMKAVLEVDMEMEDVPAQQETQAQAQVHTAPPRPKKMTAHVAIDPQPAPTVEELVPTLLTLITKATEVLNALTQTLGTITASVQLPAEIKSQIDQTLQTSTAPKPSGQPKVMSYADRARAGGEAFSAPRKPVRRKADAAAAAAQKKARELRDDTRTMQMDPVLQTQRSALIGKQAFGLEMNQWMKSVPAFEGYRKGQPIEAIRRDGKGTMYVQFTQAAWPLIDQILTEGEHENIILKTFGQWRCGRVEKSKVAGCIPMVITNIPVGLDPILVSKDIIADNFIDWGLEGSEAEAQIVHAERLKRRLRHEHPAVSQESQWVDCGSIRIWVQPKLGEILSRDMTVKYAFSFHSCRHYNQVPLFCTNCNMHGSHSSRYCRAGPTCRVCGGPHLTSQHVRQFDTSERGRAEREEEIVAVDEGGVSEDDENPTRSASKLRKVVANSQ